MMKRFKNLLIILSVFVYLFIGVSNVFAVERVYILPSTTNKKAPQTNMFQLKGSSDKYILLDSTEEGYFILAQKYCALKPYSKDGTPVAFDPEDENSIAYWLNHDYLNDPNVANRLPQAMIDNLVERVYTTEGGGSKSEFKTEFRSEYKVKCKVVLLSQTEWSKYNSKFGYGDDTSSAYWILRSVRELTGSPLIASASGSNGGLTLDGKWTSTTGIRPAFYLSKDFFEKVSLDMENTGDAIKSILRKNYGAAELGQVYNYNEVATLTQMDIAPAAESVTVTGRGIVGEKIVGKYSFVSLDDKTENGTMIQWQRSEDKEIWSTILGAESTEYVPTVNDVGYYIRMVVSPMTGSMAGASYKSVPLSCKIREISKPVATDVRILNEQPLKPGAILDVKYSFNDENRDICSETEYIWESSDDMTSAQKIGSKRNYKLTNAEAGKYIRVGVIPKKQTNSASGRETVAGECVYTEWIKVESLPVVSEVKITRNVDAEITVSKTQESISIKSILMPAKKIEKLTAQYSMEKDGDYTVVCEWQGADSKDGRYSYISSDSDALEFVPNKTMWVRAKVYTQIGKGKSQAVYSEPVFVGEDKDREIKGEYTLTQKLTAGKKYEIWISNDTSTNSYAYSFEIKGNDIPAVVSDSYMTKTINQADGVFVIGTLVSDIYSSEACFKAGEITPENNIEVTVSNALTTAVGGNEVPVTQARVFVVEK